MKELLANDVETVSGGREFEDDIYCAQTSNTQYTCSVYSSQGELKYTYNSWEDDTNY